GALRAAGLEHGSILVLLQLAAGSCVNVSVEEARVAALSGLIANDGVPASLSARRSGYIVSRRVLNLLASSRTDGLPPSKRAANRPRMRTICRSRRVGLDGMPQVYGRAKRCDV